MAGRLSRLPLGAKIFLTTSLLILLAVTAAITVASIVLRRAAFAEIDQDLEAAVNAQTAFSEQRIGRLNLVVRQFASDPSLVAYVAEAVGTRDASSVLDLLNERGKEIGYDFAIVLDPEGRTLARTDRRDAGESLASRPLVVSAEAEGEAVGVWREGGRLYDAVAVMLRKDFIAQAFLVAAFSIDDQTALGVKRASGTEVAFLARGDGEGASGMRVVATTVPELSERLIGALGAADSAVAQAMNERREVPRAELSLRGERWIARAVPIVDADGSAVGASVALASLDRALAPYRQVQRALLASGLGALLLALFLSFALARRLLEPVRRLATAAEAARQGDYNQKLAIDRTDEVGRLAQAFEHLLGDLREKRDMEEYVTELSRSLPEPAGGRVIVGSARRRDLIAVGVDLRRYANAGAETVDGTTTAGTAPAELLLDRLAHDLKRVAGAIAGRRGTVEVVSGRRLIARFEGEGRALRALSAASEILALEPEGPESPALALASGPAVSGPLAWREPAEYGFLGRPLDQVESLLREAAAGELTISREVHAELEAPLAEAGFKLPPRRGLVSGQTFFALNASVAARASGVRGTPVRDVTSATPTSVLSTLSGIEPGRLMGSRFEILSVLGAGGMGVVYKARDRELDDLVALKMLKRELWGDPNHLERLKVELKLARKITHPNVLRTHDFGEIDGVPYISMEYVRGVTLRYLLDQTKTLPYSAGLRLAKQLCAGLGAAHAVGVLHRDIKPENLILEPTGNAKLMDFGIARPTVRTAPGQTQAGWVVGTPQYLSPEQLQGKEGDMRSDVYACGVVFYEIFTGAPPFVAASPVEVMLKHLKEEPPPPVSDAGPIPAPLAKIVLRCLKKDPDERYRTVVELQKDLEALSA